VTSTSETAFTQSAETVNDFVTNPAKIDADHAAVALEPGRSPD
jgi:hypothetical protein